MKKIILYISICLASLYTFNIIIGSIHEYLHNFISQYLYLIFDKILFFFDNPIIYIPTFVLGFYSLFFIEKKKNYYDILLTIGVIVSGIRIVGLVILGV